MRITYFVHSITQDNEQGIATGWLDGELSAEGIARAKEMSSGIKEKKFDAVFSSDLRRATHSTDLFFERRVPVFIDWRLRECSYGDLDGKPTKDFKSGREEEYIETAYPGGESYRDVEKRVRSFLDDAKVLFPDGNIAVVSHQAPQLALDVMVKGETWHTALAKDWRRTKAWQPGWEYFL